uniref:FAD-dependent oxidoreductase n=1 Tax=Lachnoclostridium phocaeense TaxID=1871021 RepID=UPI0026DBB7CE|nr:FAD-dependent oxidoreductase [Lachnoclostridium phocaeense]
MIIGCPKEMKIGETRVALTPEWVRNLVSDGHEVLIQTNAGLASGFPDEEYVAVGGKIVPTIEDVYKNAEFVAKVKELMPEEFDLLQKDQIVMAWFHLAEDVDHDMLNAMLEHGTIGLGMELIKLPDGTRPTIKPMSEIAGSLAMLEAVKYGLVDRGGKGNLFRKLSGLPAPRVVIIGGGHAGLNAAEIALGLGLRVTIIENYWKRIAELRYMIPGAEVVAWEDETAFNYIKEADVLLNTIYPQPNQPCLVPRSVVQQMKKDAVIVDIVGVGVIETVHYTSLEDPIYYEEGILHYNVANMPALCPKTSTKALLIVSGPYIQAIANKGLKKAFEDDPCLKKSICTLHGQVVDDECARNHERACVPFELSMLD